MKTVKTAQQAFERYREFRANNALIQEGWHKLADDGRQLACAGILLRAEKRGKKLPTLLRTALTEVAQTAKDSG